MAIRLRRAALNILVLGALLWPSTAAADWRRLDSPNFIVIGDVSARELREVAMQFEGFRETLTRVLSARATGTAVPTVVVVFPNNRAFTPYKPVYNGKPVDVGGVFYGGRDVNIITLLRDGRPGTLRVLFHEYAHLVVSNVAMNLPAWLSEGLAEHYSTYEYLRGGREARIGQPIDSHLYRLAEERLLPLDELITVTHESPLYNEGERRSVFYAQSWALTHMLLLGEPPRVKELSVYVQELQLGTPEKDAWRKAFGNAQLERDLDRYLGRETFRLYAFTFPERIARFEGEAVDMAPPDVAGFLGELRIRQQRLEDAEALVAPVLDAGQAQLPTIARARLDIDGGRYEDAMARLTKLADSEDWFASYSAGIALTRAIERNRTAEPGAYAEARRHLETVLQRRELPNALAMLAWLDVLAPEGASKETVARLVSARTLAPGRDDYALMHAHALADTGEFDAARQTLGPLLVPGAPEHVRTAARTAMENVVRMENFRRQQAARRDAADAAPPPTATDLPAGDSKVVLLLRELKEGEERTEGRLTRIDCPRKGPVVFHLTTPAGPVTLEAAGMGDVDFVTYREDLTGSVACGQLPKPLPVYVTLKPAPTAGSRLVVAIEFLPDK